jgi:hypothetical protein
MCSNWSSLIVARGSPFPAHSGAAADIGTLKRPCRTKMPTEACSILFAIDHDGCLSSGPKPAA